MNSTDGVLCALLLGDYSADRRLVRDVFRRSGWELQEARNRGDAINRAREGGVQVVIAESIGWQDLLNDLRQLPGAPQLIVTSHTADDHLWAAVLNHGGFDVLPQPFDREELQRVVAAAGRQASAEPAAYAANRLQA